MERPELEGCCVLTLPSRNVLALLGYKPSAPAQANKLQQTRGKTQKLKIKQGDQQAEEATNSGKDGKGSVGQSKEGGKETRQASNG